MGKTSCLHCFNFSFGYFKKSKLTENASSLESYFKNSINSMNICKVKGKGLMLGLEFDFEVSESEKTCL